MDSCRFVDCAEIAEYICECTKEKLKFCSDHIDIHIKEENDHKVVKNYIEISAGDKKMISMQCGKCISKFQQIKENNVQKSKDLINKVIELTAKSNANNRELEILHLLVLEYLSKNDKVILKENQTNIEKFILEYIRDPNNIYIDLVKRESEGYFDLEYEQKISMMAKEIEEINKELTQAQGDNEKLNQECSSLTQQLEEINKEFGAFKENSETIDQEYQKMLKTTNYLKKTLTASVYADLIDESFKTSIMCYFDQNTKNMCKIDVLSNADTRTTLNMPDNLGIFSGFCEISNSECFYCSGNHNGYVDYCYVININDNTAAKKSASKQKSTIGACCAYKNFIYVFGGINSSGN